MNYDFAIPDYVAGILAKLESAGFEAYIVGGSIRDILRGVTPVDWDVATQATPDQVKGLFPRTVDTGLKHGTVTVLQGGFRVEVTTYRIDGEYLDGRRPENVTFSKDVYKDLSRRDFTMNAIAYNPLIGFTDPFDGRGDIIKQQIKCVGVAEERFKEDALRMLRAIRFSAVLGFNVDEKILEAISVMKNNLNLVSGERIREEMGKLILGAYPDALLDLHKTRLLPLVLRGAKENIPDTSLVTKVVRWFKDCPLDEPMRLALLLFPYGELCERILCNLRYDNKTIKTTMTYVRCLEVYIPPNRVEIKKFIRTLPLEIFDRLLSLKIITGKQGEDSVAAVRAITGDIIQQNEAYKLADLAVKGDDLIEMGFPPGKAMGDILETLLGIVIKDPALNTREALLDYCKRREPQKIHCHHLTADY